MAVAVLKCVITICAMRMNRSICSYGTCILVMSEEINGLCYSFLQFYVLKGFTVLL